MPRRGGLTEAVLGNPNCTARSVVCRRRCVRGAVHPWGPHNTRPSWEGAAPLAAGAKTASRNQVTQSHAVKKLALPATHADLPLLPNFPGATTRQAQVGTAPALLPALRLGAETPPVLLGWRDRGWGRGCHGQAQGQRGLPSPRRGRMSPALGSSSALPASGVGNRGRGRECRPQTPVPARDSGGVCSPPGLGICSWGCALCAGVQG